MTSWRDRLCGSVAMGNPGDENKEQLRQFFNPSENISCGGGFYPASQNVANVSTLNNFLLPTKNYSVLIFKKDGSAVIYSDEEPNVSAEELELEELKLRDL